MADHNSTPSQQVFDHPQAEWKPKIEPDGVSDDLSREAMTAVKGVANFAHTRKIIQKSGTAINVTVPAHHRARRFAAAAWQRQSVGLGRLRLTLRGSVGSGYA